MAGSCARGTVLPMKTILFGQLSVLLVGAALSLSATAQTPAPVGSWFGRLHGAEDGSAFINFNSDQTVTGMGYDHRHVIPFAITGQWSPEPDGRVTTELAFLAGGVSRPVTGVVVARRDNRLTVSAVGPEGEFRLRARPSNDATPALSQAVALVSRTTSNACTDQCNLNYSTCTYMALAARNSCMLRCSMMVPHNPKRCSTTCLSYWRGLVKSCDATNNACLAACPP